MNQNYDSDLTLNYAVSALCYRLDLRIEHVLGFMETGSRKDVQTFFPTLINSIFGLQGFQNWGLRIIMPNNYSGDFMRLLNFLKPLGPLFRMIYGLLEDPTLKYDFNLCYAPEKIRVMLESGRVHPFYRGMLVINPQTKQSMLQLNPFDYYMFHFAYHLIQPNNERVTCEDSWNSAYYHIMIDYLLHFFPTNMTNQILPNINYYNGKNPLQNVPIMMQRTPNKSLLLSGMINNATKDCMLGLNKHPRNEIWRSETILMAFIDFWLCNDQVCQQYGGFNVSATSLYHHDLPSADYIRIVRAFIKHLHAFASTANQDNSSMGELKKISLPMMQSRMYVFLRNLVYRWPLDESFKLVLELWLSFIQPWRYSQENIYRSPPHKSSAANNESDIKEDVRQPVSEEYLPFIADNLLSYIIIFQQLLPRFTRIDLASPKNAQMLYRLTKIFNQPNLIPLIRKIENVVETKNYSPTHMHNISTNSSYLPPLSPTKSWSTTGSPAYNSTFMNVPKVPSNYHGEDSQLIASKYLNIVRQKMHEFEGPNFCYKPLFIAPPASEVYELLDMIKVAEGQAMSLLDERKKLERKAYGFWALFMPGSIVDDFSYIDRQKTPLLLKASADALMEMFNVKDYPDLNITPESTTSSNVSKSHQFPRALTLESVRKRRHDYKYDGDPDLIPIQSYENKYLVRAFHEISCKINEKYGAEIKNLYYREGILGRFSRKFIHHPEIVYKFKKDDGISERVSYKLAPRISLRHYAENSFIIFLIIGSILFNYFNLGKLSFLATYVVAVLFYKFLKAVLFKDEPVQLNLNLSETMEY